MIDDDGALLRERMRSLPLTRAGDTPVRARLVGLCVASSRDLQFSGTSIRLMTHRERSAIAAASTNHAVTLDEAQFGLGEGPTSDAFASGRPVLAHDLGFESRWPAFTRAALLSHCEATFAFPLADEVGRYGAMTHYSHSPRELTDTEVSECSIYATVATELLLENTPSSTDRHPARAIADALDLRVEVFQAQGIVMVDLDVSLDEAMACLRARAYSESRTLNELAVDVVSGAVRFDPAGTGPVTAEPDPDPDQES